MTPRGIMSDHPSRKRRQSRSKKRRRRQRHSRDRKASGRSPPLNTRPDSNSVAKFKAPPPSPMTPSSRPPLINTRTNSNSVPKFKTPPPPPRTPSSRPPIKRRRTPTTRQRPTSSPSNCSNRTISRHSNRISMVGGRRRLIRPHGYKPSAIRPHGHKPSAMPFPQWQVRLASVYLPSGLIQHNILAHNGRLVSRWRQLNSVSTML